MASIHIPDHPSDINDLCDKIRKATKGFGTDEKALIKVLGPLGPVERYHLAKKYEEEYGTSLAKLMEKEEGNSDFGKVLQLLAQPIEEAECSIIHMACKGMDTNEKLIYTILCGRSNEEINILKKTYYRMYGKDLTAKLAGELGGNLELLITACLQAEEEEYDSEIHTDEKAKDDARAFDKAGREKMGTDEATLFKLICTSPPAYLHKVNLAHVERAGYSLSVALEKELGGKAEAAAIHAVNMKLKPVETAVRLIESTMKGVGTDEYDLAVMILIYQALLGSGFPAYEEEYGKTLEKRVKGELRGDFEDLIVEMIEADVQT